LACVLAAFWPGWPWRGRKPQAVRPIAEIRRAVPKKIEDLLDRRGRITFIIDIPFVKSVAEKNKGVSARFIAFHLIQIKSERLYGLVFTAKSMVKVKPL